MRSLEVGKYYRIIWCGLPHWCVITRLEQRDCGEHLVFYRAGKYRILTWFWTANDDGLKLFLNRMDGAESFKEVRKIQVRSVKY